ncbi:MAG TPA: hypothetical protein VK464_16400 [Symbiobacteriaceae bacterium]|nr:hypothetical protein [Symbiobacteriaceae bacterium]
MRSVTMWKASAVAVALAVSAWAGGGSLPGRAPDQAVVKTQQQRDQEMFAAVQLLLKNVPRQDQPKKILSVKAEGTDTYVVHVEMVQGEGWFRLHWDGRVWQATGIPGPGAGG